MPTYLFRCGRCFETWQLQASMADGAPASPLCECGKVMRRVWSAPGIVLKGSGWGKDGK